MSIKVRIDKWLWSVRIFKSRTIATDFVKSGKVKINGFDSKASSNVQIGDLVTVKKNGFNFLFKVNILIDKRVGAAIAVNCYEDKTPPEELNKYNDWFVGKGIVERRDKGTGRPTKRERRDIDEYKENYFDWSDDDSDLD